MKKIYSFCIQNTLSMITLIALSINTVVHFVPFLFFGILKLLPFPLTKTTCRKVLDKLTSHWISFNNTFVKNTRTIQWHVKGNLNLRIDRSYIVISNHQTWLDIVVLQNLLHCKIPNLKFFIKDALKWIPMLGFAWWVLDCPFIKRYSKSYLDKYPEKKGKDIETVKRACNRFLQIPVAITNFLEGTRFNLNKKKKQNSPYRHLLRPKAGGLAYVIQAMGDKVNAIIDVTIIYHKSNVTLWDYLCGRIRKISVNVRQISIPEKFKQMDYANDNELKKHFHQWLNHCWFEKDTLIDSMKKTMDSV